MTSGSNPEYAEASNEDQQHAILVGILDRQTALGSLDALVSALRPSPSTVALGRTALALDASVFLRISGHSSSEDIVDYLSTRHEAPLILPGQAIQEFWNNQLHAVDTIASGLGKRFDVLRADLGKIDSNFGDYAAQIDLLLEKFRAEHGHLYDEATIRKTLTVLEMLQKRALVPYAPRLQFSQIAIQRKKTKTPPGFKDDGDGDFFIWVDLLKGVHQALAAGNTFGRVVFVTHDRKVDWSRAGVAHPILVAEVRALAGLPFEIWNLDQLATEITRAS